MNIIVTGAGGLIGSYTYNLLRETENKVFALFKQCDTKSENIIVGDLESKEFVGKLSNYNPEIIVHCAAILPGIKGNPSLTAAQSNRLIDDNIIDYCERKKCKLIYISGTSLYAQSLEVSSEETTPKPLTEYLIEKYNSEKRIKSKLKDHVILRVSAPYGSTQKSNTVLKLFIQKALQSAPLEYFGSGNRKQDFTNVSDVANAIFLCTRKNISGTYNIASAKPISMIELALLIKSLLSQSTSKVVPSNTPDPEEGYSAMYDISKAKKILGWEPKISLEQGILEFADNLRSQK